MDSKLCAQAVSVSLLFTSGTKVQLIFYSEMLNQLQNWILREPVLSYGSSAPCLISYTLMTQFMKVGLTLCSLMCIRAFW